MEGTVHDVIRSGASAIVSLLDEYQNLSALLESESSDATLSRLEEVQSAITALGGWELEAQIDDLVARTRARI